MLIEHVRAALGPEQRPATDLVLLRIAQELQYARNAALTGVAAAFTAERMAAVLARVVAEIDRAAEVQARYTALAEEATARLAEGLLGESAGADSDLVAEAR